MSDEPQVEELPYDEDDGPPTVRIRTSKPPKPSARAEPTEPTPAPVLPDE